LVPANYVVSYEQFELQKETFLPTLTNQGTQLKTHKINDVLHISNNKIKAGFNT